MRPAVFLDRDGTVIDDPGYLGDPAQVRVVPGGAEAIARLNRAGLLVVMVTNQSGIGRGMYDEAAFHAVQRRVEELLSAAGARLDAVYYCPHAPDHAPPCGCRKPAPGLFLRAAADHGIDLSGSFFVGDRARDVSPAETWGATAILVDGTPDEPAPQGAHREPSLGAAVDRILRTLQVDRT